MERRVRRMEPMSSYRHRLKSTEHLSLYSAEYEDGREIISECFSAFYSKTGNPFAEDYIALCKEVVVDEVI